jgi:hypothetical protein
MSRLPSEDTPRVARRAWFVQGKLLAGGSPPPLERPPAGFPQGASTDTQTVVNRAQRCFGGLRQDNADARRG